MKRNILNILSTLAVLLFAACNRHTTSNAEADFIATIQPIKYIVEQITGDDFRVEVLVPKGASPETFEPTPKQAIALNEAKLVFSTGLIDFENALTERIHNSQSLINLSRGIELMEGSCSHQDHLDHLDHDHHAHAHSHHHGIDPHIWTSPRELKAMARNAYEAIIAAYPDSTKYTDSYNALIHKFNELDLECRHMCEASSARAFVVYHPALTYFARAYSIEQIAIEDDGKEPSVKHLADIIEQAREKGVTCLLYQAQYPRSTVEVVAKDMGVECQEFDPLAEDVVANIRSITRLITNL